MNLAPIALFVYNRPEHTLKTVEHLKNNPQARESELWVFSDGAKNPAAGPQVKEVRQIVGAINGFKKVHVIESKANKGLAHSITSGVSQLCAASGRAIVVEDDLTVSPDFLRWMNAGLDRYANDTHVMQVSGYMFPVPVRGGVDAHFLPIINCWGWGVWDRSWQLYDANATGYEDLERDADLRRRFNLDDAHDYFSMLRDQKQGRIDSWGIRWQLSLFRNKGLVLYPPVSLVTNVGFDGSGTHAVSKQAGSAHVSAAGRVSSAPKFSDTAAIDPEIYQNVRHHLLDSVGLRTRIARLGRKLITAWRSP